MNALLVKSRDVFFSTGIKWKNSSPYCGQLPALEKIQPGWCGRDFG
jgi:hypothetical protein